MKLRFGALAILALLSISAASAGPYDASASSGASWLLRQQNIVDGSWGATDDIKYVQTSEAVLALAALNRRTSGYYAGITWLENHSPVNIDFKTRRILALQINGNNVSADLQDIQAAQDVAAPGNSGWGLSNIYKGAALDTALSLQASNQAGGSANIPAAVNYLIASQLAGASDKGWVIGQESISDPASTAHVLLALIPLQASNTALPLAISNGLATLNNQVTNTSSVPYQALSALANLRNNPASVAGNNLLNNLVVTQDPLQGSWGGDIYATALALRALAVGMSLDLAVQREIVSVPDDILRGAINSALGRNSMDNLNKGELAKLTNLSINGLGITSLSGLQYASNLTYLDARNNNISSFGILSGLTAANILKDGNPGFTQPPLIWNLVSGWNLIGNGSTSAFSVSALFGNATYVGSVWKWVHDKSTWAFYSPALADSGVAYAASHGYDFLTTITPGEGFWVVAATPFSTQLNISSLTNTSVFRPGGTNALPSGWNMVATGDNPTPSDFNKSIGIELPAPGVIPINLKTLWAWEPVSSKWYFYHPGLEQNGTLSAYNASNGNLNFGINTLTPTTGIWLNK